MANGYAIQVKVTLHLRLVVKITESHTFQWPLPTWLGKIADPKDEVEQIATENEKNFTIEVSVVPVTTPTTPAPPTSGTQSGTSAVG